ncbi:dTDP-4-dehydrorhamnose reductase [Modicisalibacter tunisiensis]|uniref:dTDP-4-dehydrorhamnose reductase n=1 Tax=Modicisalibacter tunisiensis TaxID=390637 RepID=UPI00362E7CF2
MATHRPKLVLNAAAYTAVDKAESEPAQAERLNSGLPAQLAGYAAAMGAYLVHYSTDYVYPGYGESAWHERSDTQPLSVYGKTKLAGDEAVMYSGCQHLIFRTSWVYAARGKNFLKSMLTLGRERDSLAVVNDQIGAPTPARLIALVTLHAWQQRIASGVYHLAPTGTTSWHGFASEIFKQAEEAGVTLSISSGQVSGIPTEEYPTPATRPLNSRLALNKLETALGITMPHWKDQLALTLQEHLEPLT